MLDYLDKLRMKPRHVRERIAFSVTAIFSVFIVSMWWVSWSVDSVIKHSYSSNDITPVRAAVDIADRAKDSTSDLLTGLVGQAEYDASSTEVMAQVIGAFKNEVPNDATYAEDPAENMTDTNAIPIESSTSTPVE